MSEGTIDVEVAYATPDEQVIVPMHVEEGTTLEAAIRRSGLLERFEEIDLAENKVGVFGKLASPGSLLQDGDRVEIYRPLIADPKEARKRRAAEGKAMTKGARDADAPAGD
ncbi:MAG: RnfH family protein [Gammaproteobacteria bacterium]|jgi:putative ubiquitin-RnfH superfamily antitoxin RatB of RatAB toxin-antitoxin module